MYRRIKFLVAAVVLAVMAFSAGAAAQGGPWSKPGDPVTTLDDADRAIAWWNGQARAASREPVGLADANDRLWLAMGQIVDDLMGLDLRTRAEGLTAPTHTIRSVSQEPEIGEGFAVVTALCAKGERVTGGGFDIPAFGNDGLTPGINAVAPVSAYPIVVDGTEGWAARLPRVPDEPGGWAPVTLYANCTT